MARIKWDQAGERTFETGIDRGVLYVPEIIQATIGEGVPWNGLISVTETPTGGEVTPYYTDGIMHAIHLASEEFEASIDALSIPEEFNQFMGVNSIGNGLYASQQPKKEFHLSYRTKVGNDLDSVEHGYKIHLLYNAVLLPTGRRYITTGETTETSSFTFNIKTRPMPFPELNSSVSHLVLDSRGMSQSLLNIIEDFLYGNSSNPPFFPNFQYLYDLFSE